MEPIPEDWQLLSFFESEPDVLDAGVPWAYNTLSFRTRRGPDEIHCTIEPGYETLRFTWSRDHAELMDLRLRWVYGNEITMRQVLKQLDFQSTSRSGNQLPGRAPFMGQRLGAVARFQ